MRGKELSDGLGREVQKAREADSKSNTLVAGR